MDCPEFAYEWEEVWKNLVCLAVKDEDHLLDLLDVVDDHCPVYSAFKEPDLNDEFTSLAVLAPESFSNKYFSHLPLSLRSSPKGGE